MNLRLLQKFYQRLSLDEAVLRNGLFLIALFTALSYLISGFPFSPLFSEVAILRAGFRIAFGVVLFISLVRSRNMLPVLYGYKNVLQNKQNLPIIITFYSQFVLLALLITGLLTEFVALLLFGVRTAFIERTKRFGLENTLNQMVIVHLPFLGLGATYSVDSLLGISPLISSPTMFNSLFILTGVMMVSGANHKLGSKIWLRGDAVKEFLKLPHIRNSLLRNVSLPVSSPTSIVLSYTMILAQLLLLFSVLNKWMFLAICLIFIGFSISMFAIVDLSYIGQTFLPLILLYGGTVVLNFQSYPHISTILTPSVTPFTGFAIVVVVLGLFMVLQTDLISGTRLRSVARILSGQNAPVKPFNEQHLQGIHTFRFIHEDPDTGERESVIEVFDEDGWQKQTFHPRYYQASVYVVTDYCLAVQHDEIDASIKESELIDLCCAGLFDAEKDNGNIYLQIKVFENDLEQYLESEWQMIGVCRFRGENASWELLNDPPQFNSHPRLNFDFDNS